MIFLADSCCGRFGAWWPARPLRQWFRQLLEQLPGAEVGTARAARLGSYELKEVMRSCCPWWEDAAWWPIFPWKGVDGFGRVRWFAAVRGRFGGRKCGFWVVLWATFWWAWMPYRASALRRRVAQCCNRLKVVHSPLSWDKDFIDWNKKRQKKAWFPRIGGQQGWRCKDINNLLEPSSEGQQYQRMLESMFAHMPMISQRLIAALLPVAPIPSAKLAQLTLMLWSPVRSPTIGICIYGHIRTVISLL